MNDRTTSRRRFLVSALTVSGLATGALATSLFRESTAWAKDPQEPLTRLARLLFPHNDLGDSVYKEAVANAFALTAEDPAAQGLLASAEEALDAAVAAGGWYDADETAQLAALTAVQDQAFFAAIRNLFMFTLYTHKGCWNVIGYPGSSKEHGGYLERGFDDIDWLPETAS
jgi:hypothetical protein